MTDSTYFSCCWSLIIVIFIFCAYSEIKNRKIENYCWSLFYLIGLVALLFEASISKNFLVFFFFKLLIVLIVSIFSIFFFMIKIFGGSDGKLIILFYAIQPNLTRDLNDIISLFIIIALFLYILILINSISNKIQKNTSLLKILKIHEDKEKLRGLYSVNLVNLLDFHKFYEKGAVLRCNFIVYNGYKNKFQLVVQKRPPIIIIIIISIFCISMIK